MEGDTSEHGGIQEASNPLHVADPDGKMQGDQVLGSNTKPALQNGDATMEQQQDAADAGQKAHASPAPQVASNQPKTNGRALPTIEHNQPPGLEPAITVGALPPLNIRSDFTKESMSMKIAALTVMSAGSLQNYRRSSAAMHIDLLRVFVPDMLINVCAKGDHIIYTQRGSYIRHAVVSARELTWLAKGSRATDASMPHPPVPSLHSAHEQYLENASKPLESQAFFVKAACMCADISGFTALSEKHCKKGTAGLDTLVQVRFQSFYHVLSSFFSTETDSHDVRLHRKMCLKGSWLSRTV